MSKRRKRAKKGIDSIRKQIEIHSEKLQDARKKGNIFLAEYYEKEIESMKAALTKKLSLCAQPPTGAVG